MRFDFIDPSDHRWNEAVTAAAEHDVYDLAEYAVVCGKYEDATPIAFYASEGPQFCLIPLLQRPLPPSLGRRRRGPTPHPPTVTVPLFLRVAENGPFEPSRRS